MIHRFFISLAIDSINRGEEVPFVDMEGCFNKKQKRQECKICRNICPKGAITYEKRIKIDSSLCNGCHLCYGSCPARCIWPGHSFIKKNGRIEEGILRIGCRQQGKSSAGINVPCIASLPWEFYGLMSYLTPISIMKPNCSQCDFRAESVVRGIVERLRLFWGEDYSQRILSHTEVAPAKYSRREVLELFIKKEKRPEEWLALKGKDQDFEKHPSSYRNLLLMELEPSRVHGWLTWRINGTCRGCKVCQKLCPCGALQIVTDGEKHTLTHDVLKCINCQICKLICPEKSIEQQIEVYTTKDEPVVPT